MAEVEIDFGISDRPTIGQQGSDNFTRTGRRKTPVSCERGNEEIGARIRARHGTHKIAAIKTVGRWVDDMVVFVTNAIPGDVVDILVLKKRKSYCEGKILAYKEYSSARTQPFCAHFGTCGGCKWQYLPYEKQLFYKQKQVADQLRRIGHPIRFPAGHEHVGGGL